MGRVGLLMVNAPNAGGIQARPRARSCWGCAHNTLDLQDITGCCAGSNQPPACTWAPGMSTVALESGLGEDSPVRSFIGGCCFRVPLGHAVVPRYEEKHAEKVSLIHFGHPGTTSDQLL